MSTDTVDEIAAISLAVAFILLGIASRPHKRRYVWMLAIVVGVPIGAYADSGAMDGPSCGWIGMPIIVMLFAAVGIAIRFGATSIRKWVTQPSSDPAAQSPTDLHNDPAGSGRLISRSIEDQKPTLDYSQPPRPRRNTMLIVLAVVGFSIILLVAAMWFFGKASHPTDQY